MFERLRRNRKNVSIRHCLAENSIKASDFIMPLFIKGDLLDPVEIPSLPGNKIHTLASLIQEAKMAFDEGVGCFLLFPVIEAELKDEEGNFSLSEDNIIYLAIEMLKEALPHAVVMADVALDPYTSHGHDGLINQRLEIDNDRTIQKLVELSICLAEAGVDYVAPSDMMDGRVIMIREALDEAGYKDVGIMSYSAKFASSLYGPFRDTLGSSLKFGDKKSYQLSYANQKEALLESLVDVDEGADLILVKPATLYMDIISKLSESCLRPIGAYHVSGEYAMACALHDKGQLNLEEYLKEVFTSLKRAGAQFIITYGYPIIRHLLK
jgi:porphobilinogen synthase